MEKMEIIENEDFNDYIEQYKKLKLKDKQKIIINLLKEDIMVRHKLITEQEDEDDEVKMLYNREILDVNDDDYSEEDFSEAVIVYLYSIRELIAEYIEKKGGV